MWNQIQEQDSPQPNPARSDDSCCILAGPRIPIQTGASAIRMPT
jgi:hypothetical protein